MLVWQPGCPGVMASATGVCDNSLIACWGEAWDSCTLALPAHPRLIQHVGSEIICSWPTDRISFSLSLWHLNYPHPLPCEAAGSAVCLGQSRGDHQPSDVQGADCGPYCTHPSATFCCVGVALQRRQGQAPSRGQKAGGFVEAVLLFPL